MTRPVVCKLGGELIEDAARRTAAADAIARTIERHRDTPVIVVHGGGKDIDAALKAAGLEKRQVDGLRITDAPTLDVVVAVLAGRVNTQFVATLNAAGVPAVGLTGADARVAVAIQAAPHRSATGAVIDLGYVGEPVADSDPRLLRALLASGYVPVLASIGSTMSGGLLNVNADTLAAHVAVAVNAERLVIAGGTPGVLDADGRSIAALDTPRVAALIADGIASAGMIAKLRACERALAGGVDDVIIVDGRAEGAIAEAAGGVVPADATRIAAGDTRRPFRTET